VNVQYLPILLLCKSILVNFKGVSPILALSKQNVEPNWENILMGDGNVTIVKQSTEMIMK